MISFRSRRLDHTHDAPNKRNMCKIHGGGGRGGGGEFRKFAVFFPSLLVLRSNTRDLYNIASAFASSNSIA